MTIKFCSQCGQPVEWRTPQDEDVPRHVCTVCGTIHYLNPKIVVGCIPEWGDRILLCKRAIEPRYGLWTLPAGFMENDETTQEGAARETHEEATAHVEVGDLYAIFNLPHVNQVYMMYRARLIKENFGPGRESLDVALYHESDIPWTEIAFPVITETLRLYFEDRQSGHFGTHSGDIIRDTSSYTRYRTRHMRRR